MTSTQHAWSRRRFVVPALLALLMVLAGMPSGTVAGAAPTPSTQPPGAFVLVDADTGLILAAHNEHQALLTASAIKPFTAIVALEHLSTTATIRVSARAAAQPASKIDMKEGSTWPIKHVLDSLMIVSANDAAYALAENAGGDLDGFALLAAETATRLGMRDTTFRDPAGLDGQQGFGGGTTSSAYDLAIIARNALSVPAIAEPAARLSEEFTDPSGVGRRLTNHNRGFLNSFSGAIGLKTGYTDAAGRTLITAARRDGRTLIAVVLGTWDDTGWASYYLDQGFAGLQPPAGAAVLPPVRVATIDTRTALFNSLPRVLGAAAAPTATTGIAPALAAAPVTPAAPAPAAPKPSQAPGARAPSNTPSAAGNQGATPSNDTWPIGPVVRTVGLTLLGLFVIFIGLRRRAVKRQRARRIERMRAHAEARRRGMIDVVTTDDSDIRLFPASTSHHVAAAGKRHPSERRVLRPARPRSNAAAPRDPSR